MKYAKHNTKPYKDDNLGWADNDVAQELKRMLDTPACRMYSGRRMFRRINISKIRMIMNAAKFYQ